MHASNSTLHPRQRTFTSCTECRRRKQRCNQAKDKKCNNCMRRWPPVLCTYSENSRFGYRSSSSESISDGCSSSPSFDRVIDLRNVDAQPVFDPSAGSHPSYMQTSQSDFSGLPASTTANNYYSTASSGSYTSTATTRPEYCTYQGEISSPGSRAQYSSVSNAGSYAVADAGYYPSNQMEYSSAGTTSGYYPTTDYYTTNGDPAAFVGATSAEYYYVEPDIDDVPGSRS